MTIRRRLYAVLVKNIFDLLMIWTLIRLLYFVCLSLGAMNLFCSMLGTTAFSLSGRAISLFLLKLGCSPGLSLAIGLAVKALLTSGVEANMMNPSESGGNSSASKNYWEEWDIDFLLETTSSENQSEGTSQPEAGPSNQSEGTSQPEAGPSNQTLPVVPYPYQSDEEIGGDCVRSIQRRLLSKTRNPTSHDIQMAHLTAQDLFEVKVDIIREMAVLDPTGDWLGRGARALDNPRTATGEASLQKLHEQLAEIRQNGVHSHTFNALKKKVALKRKIDLDDDDSIA